jgi:hypothetical protein
VKDRRRLRNGEPLIDETPVRRKSTGRTMKLQTIIETDTS